MYYVYVHCRNDSGQVFYAGKGSGARARCKQGRNRYWRAVAAKAGYTPAVIVAGLDEELALLAEVELIDVLRRRGIRLTNLTDGGEGMSGYSMPPEVIERRAATQRGVRRPHVSALLKGMPKSASHRAALADSARGRKVSDETRRKQSQRQKGQPSFMLGKRHTPDARAKISAALVGEGNPFFGRKHQPDVLARIRAANLGRKDSEETRAKKSFARKGARNPRFGVSVPQEQKARQIATLKARPRVTCPCCGRQMDESNAKRWHFDNCRERA